MFERFTDRGRRVVVLSHEEAAGLGSDSVGPEHLLLGLLSEGSSLAARLLVSAGMDYDKALTLVGEIHSGEQQEALGEPKFTQASMEVFKAANEESSGMGHEFVTPEHLLVSLIAASDPTSDAVFGRLAIDAPIFADAIRRSTSEEARERIPPSGDLREVPLGQVCKACGASVQERGKVMPLELGVEQREPIHLQAYFCGECGSTIGLVKDS